MEISKEERDRIVEKLRIEQELREQLSPKKEERRSKWWEGNLALLLIGSLLTSLVVPWLQYTQKNFEWRRENQFENVKYRLGEMRQALTDFIVLWAFVSEAYERSRPFLLRPLTTAKEGADFQTQFIDLQNRRFQQNAKVVSLMINFKDYAALNTRFQDYLVHSAAYFRRLEELVRAKASSTTTDASPQSPDEIDQMMKRLEALYVVVSNQIREEIGRTEDESQKYRL